LGVVLHRSVFLALAPWHVRWRRPRWLGGYLAAQWGAARASRTGRTLGRGGQRYGSEERVQAAACGVVEAQCMCPGRVVSLFPGDGARGNNPVAGLADGLHWLH
jgi:hypothetical protein